MQKWFIVLTDCNNEDVTTALVNPPSPPPLKLALTGAPNPIDESCRLGQNSVTKIYIYIYKN